jgi:hypothetical protein
MTGNLQLRHVITAAQAWGFRSVSQLHQKRHVGARTITRAAPLALKSLKRRCEIAL